MSNHLICPYCGLLQAERDFIYWANLTFAKEIDEPYTCRNCGKETDSVEIVLHKKTEK